MGQTTEAKVVFFSSLKALRGGRLPALTARFTAHPNQALENNVLHSQLCTTSIRFGGK